MAKSRQQRKAEQRAKQRQTEQRAQQRTQEGQSGEVAQANAAIQGGPEAVDELEQMEGMPAPAPSRDDTRRKGRRDKTAKDTTAKADKSATDDGARRRDKRSGKGKPVPVPKPKGTVDERQRGRVVTFLISCWHELKRVQWPDRDTLVQASAVTLLFVAVAAAYLGVLDFVFNQLVQAIL
ncbi:MAG: preprotein translocase subunit SecE [Solirubrobacterales bacterium]